jgi:hypothetical protein
MKKPRSQGTFGNVIKELRPLRDGGAGELRVSIIERNGERRLDIRSFVKTDRYTGPTKKGISLSVEEFDVLISQKKRISKLLNP